MRPSVVMALMVVDCWAKASTEASSVSTLLLPLNWLYYSGAKQRATVKAAKCKPSTGQERGLEFSNNRK